MYCKYCGKPVTEDSIYCEHCGKLLSNENTDLKMVGPIKKRKCIVCGKLFEYSDIQNRTDTEIEVCEECSAAFLGKEISEIKEPVLEVMDDKIDGAVLDVLNHKEDYTYEKILETMTWLRENNYKNEADDLKCYMEKLELESRQKKDERDKKDKTGKSIIEISGLSLTILSILAIFFCMMRIHTDMTPIGLYGITADYESPFSTYEKQQIAKLVLSVMCLMVGLIMWITGKKKNEIH